MRCSILLLLLLTAPSIAGEPVYSWRTRTDDPDRVYLYRDGKQIGGWCYRGKYYRPFDGENWGTPIKISPVPPPPRFQPAAMNAMITRRSQPLRGGPMMRSIQAVLNPVIDAQVQILTGSFLDILGKAASEAERNRPRVPKP